MAGLTKPGGAGDFFALVSMKSPNFCQKAKFKSPCRSFQVRIFFTNNHTFSSIFLKCDPYRVWCSIFYSKLVNCILLRSLFVFVKGRGTCGSGERNVRIWIDFRKSPRFSLTLPLSQEREKSSHPVFTMCGEPCYGRSSMGIAHSILIR
jgi:hypothetical protein